MFRLYLKSPIELIFYIVFDDMYVYETIIFILIKINIKNSTPKFERHQKIFREVSIKFLGV